MTERVHSGGVGAAIMMEKAIQRQYRRPVLSAVMWPSFIRNVRAQPIEHNDFVRGASSRSNPRSKRRGTDSAVTLKGQRSRIDPQRWRRHPAEDHIIYLYVRYL